MKTENSLALFTFANVTLKTAKYAKESQNKLQWKIAKSGEKLQYTQRGRGRGKIERERKAANNRTRVSTRYLSRYLSIYLCVSIPSDLREMRLRISYPSTIVARGAQWARAEGGVAEPGGEGAGAIMKCALNFNRFCCVSRATQNDKRKKQSEMGKNICRIHVLHTQHTHGSFRPRSVPVWPFTNLEKCAPAGFGLGCFCGVGRGRNYLSIRYTVVEIILITFCALYGSAN